jgi:hypothetical protein
VVEDVSRISHGWGSATAKHMCNGDTKRRPRERNRVIFETITTRNFLTETSDSKSQAQGAQKTPSWRNTNKTTANTPAISGSNYRKSKITKRSPKRNQRGKVPPHL